MHEKYHFTSDAGVEIVLPHVDKIKGGVIRRHRKLDPVDMMFSIVEEIVDKDTIAKIDDLERGELNRLFEGWQEAAGANVGESSGSST